MYTAGMIVTWKMRGFYRLLVVLLAAVAFVRGADVYKISDSERLQVSQLEASVWRARYAAEVAQNSLQQSLAKLRETCEASGGAFVADPNQPASCMCTAPARDESASPASATESKLSGAPEAQEEQ